MVSIRDVRRQRKDYRRLRRRTIRSLWQIQGHVQFDFVAHWNFDAPTQVVVRRWFCRRRCRSWRLRNDIRCKERREHCNPKRSFHVAVLKMNCISETRVLSQGQSDARTRRHAASLREAAAGRAIPKLAQNVIETLENFARSALGVRSVIASLSGFARS